MNKQKRSYRKNISCTIFWESISHNFPFGLEDSGSFLFLSTAEAMTSQMGCFLWDWSSFLINGLYLLVLCCFSYQIEIIFKWVRFDLQLTNQLMHREYRSSNWRDIVNDFRKSSHNNFNGSPPNFLQKRIIFFKQISNLQIIIV